MRDISDLAPREEAGDFVDRCDPILNVNETKEMTVDLRSNQIHHSLLIRKKNTVVVDSTRLVKSNLIGFVRMDWIKSWRWVILTKNRI